MPVDAVVSDQIYLRIDKTFFLMWDQIQVGVSNLEPLLPIKTDH